MDNKDNKGNNGSKGGKYGNKGSNTGFGLYLGTAGFGLGTGLGGGVYMSTDGKIGFGTKLYKN